MLKKMNIDDCVPVLIADRPGRKRDSVQAMLKAISQLNPIEQADDGPAAMRMIAKQPPALVLVSSNLLDDEDWAILEQVKSKHPQVRCLVLTDTVEQRQRATAAGADGVLDSRFSITGLRASIEKLLPQ